MKKLTTLLFVLVFASSMAVAQNTATTNQNGNNNDITVTQEQDGGGGNVATVNQDGDDSEAIIDQTSSFGSGHTATINQGASSVLNFADILQDQANAEATVNQEGAGENEVRLKQSGYNVANVNQDGEGNRLGSYSDISNDRAFQKNGTGLFADGFNLLNLDVQGDNNDVGILQEANTEADIDVFNSSMGNEIKVYQKGENGGNLTMADVNVDDAWSNNVDIYQGDTGPGIGENTATVNLNYHDSNIIDINQLAEGNTATVNMGDGSVFGSANTATITQNSSDNVATVNVVGSSNSSTITQN